MTNEKIKEQGVEIIKQNTSCRLGKCKNCNYESICDNNKIYVSIIDLLVKHGWGDRKQAMEMAFKEVMNRLGKRYGDYAIPISAVGTVLNEMFAEFYGKEK